MQNSKKYGLEDDTESIPEGHAGQVIGDGTNLVQRSQSLLQTEDHFNDTEDVPLEQEATQMRGAALRRMHADEAWDNFYAKAAKSLTFGLSTSEWSTREAFADADDGCKVVTIQVNTVMMLKIWMMKVLKTGMMTLPQRF